MAWTQAARDAAAMTRRIHKKDPQALAGHYKNNRNSGMSRKDALSKATLAVKHQIVRASAAAKKK